MPSVLATVLRPLLAAAILGATLGAIGSVGFFFWQNREMCPCAPVGLSGEASTIAAPLTPAVRRGVWYSGGAGAGVGVVAAVIFLVPSALRMHRLSRELPGT